MNKGENCGSPSPFVLYRSRRVGEKWGDGDGDGTGMEMGRGGTGMEIAGWAGRQEGEAKDDKRWKRKWMWKG